MIARPWRRTRPTQPDVSAPTSAPKPTALNIQPTACGPRWNCVDRQRREAAPRGIPNTIATTSIVNVDWSTLRPLRNRKPASTAVQPALPLLRRDHGSAVAAATSARTRSRRRTTRRRCRRPTSRPSVRPRRCPPSAGPTTPAPFHITWLSAAAGASISGGTRFGVIAARVGIEIDTNAGVERGRAVDAARAADGRRRAPISSSTDDDHQPELRAEQDPAPVERGRSADRSPSETTIIGTSCTRPTSADRGRRVRERRRPARTARPA